MAMMMPESEPEEWPGRPVDRYPNADGPGLVSWRQVEVAPVTRTRLDGDGPVVDHPDLVRRWDPFPDDPLRLDQDGFVTGRIVPAT